MPPITFARLALVILSALPLAAVDYLAEPYLTNPKPDGITVAWVALSRCEGAVVHYGDNERYGQSAEVAEVDESDWNKHKKVYVHKVRIRGLQPGKAYQYQVSGGGLPEYANRFRTIPAATDQPVLFLLGGDYGEAWPKAEDVAFIEKTHQREVDFFLDLGDHAIGRRFREEWQGRIPVVLAKGNHDNESKYTLHAGAMGQVQHFYDFDNDELNFSLNWGPLFIVVDGTNCYKPVKDPVFQWIDQQYASTTLPWRIFACHGVFFSDCNHGIKEGPARTQQLWPLFRKHGVQWEFNGHDHVYQRTDRVNAAGEPDREGTVSVSHGGDNQGDYWKRPQSPFIAYSHRAEDRAQGTACMLIHGKRSQLQYWSRPRDQGDGWQLLDNYEVTLP